MDIRTVHLQTLYQTEHTIGVKVTWVLIGKVYLTTVSILLKIQLYGKEAVYRFSM